RHGIAYLSPGVGTVRDLSWLDGSRVADISDDGQTLLFVERRDGIGGSEAATYLRRVTAADAVRLGDGWPLGLSKDGKWALAYVAKSLVLLPTGAGPVRTVTRLDENEGAVWLPD